MKPDSTRAAIVEAIRKVGGQWFDTESVPGFPDGVWAFLGRMGAAELKAPGKANGVCGCNHTGVDKCTACQARVEVCKGHYAPKGERLVWHRQLKFREAWKGPTVTTWTTPEEALNTIGALRDATRLADGALDAQGEAEKRMFAAEAEVARLRVDMEEMVEAAGRHTALDAKLERLANGLAIDAAVVARAERAEAERDELRGLAEEVRAEVATLRAREATTTALNEAGAEMTSEWRRRALTAEADAAALRGRLARAQEPGVCGGFGGKSRVERFGCGMEIWMSGTGASGYRCLSCGMVYCKPCLQHHFESESGETKESLRASVASIVAILTQHTTGLSPQASGTLARDVQDWLRTNPAPAAIPKAATKPKETP